MKLKNVGDTNVYVKQGEKGLSVSVPAGGTIEVGEPFTIENIGETDALVQFE